MEANMNRARIDDAAPDESKAARWRKAYAGAFMLLAMAVLSCGCASYRGTASNAQPSALAREGQWTMVRNFPLVAQADDNDCGAAALAAVLRFWGHPASADSIGATLGRVDNRLQAGEMQAHARSLGMRSYVFFGTMADVIHELEQGRPVIVGLGKMVDEKNALSHYEVVVGWEPTKKQVLLLDPGRGWQVDSLDGFAREWAVSKGVTIVAFPDSGAATAGASENERTAAILPPGSALASVTDAQRYAARETASPDAKKYRAGDYIVISASALAVVLLVVLILVLI